MRRPVSLLFAALVPQTDNSFRNSPVLPADGGVAPPRHADKHDSSSRLALSADPSPNYGTHFGSAVLVGLGALFTVGVALAQETPAAGQPDEQYQNSLEPGLKLSSPTRSTHTLRGSSGVRSRQSIEISGGDSFEEPAPVDLSQTYTVQSGETLWSICERLLGSAYAWPMVWSYNPEITNPHWIYPGQVVFLSPDRPDLSALANAAPAGESLIATSGRRGTGAVMLRNRGFVDTQMFARSGSVLGAQTYRMLFAQYDTVYVGFKDDAKPAPGDEFSIYRVVRDVEPVDDEGTELGKLVEILGQARVTSYDPKTKVARAHIDETVQPFERGTLIGPVHRQFDMVAPVINDKDIKGSLVALLDEGILAGSEQIVFVDRGHADGVRQGNRFLAVEKRDKFRESLGEDDDNDGYPLEVLAELRVIEARPHTSTCLVLGATRELQVGQKVEMRRGF